jgi:hypothetical protein
MCIAAHFQVCNTALVTENTAAHVKPTGSEAAAPAYAT